MAQQSIILFQYGNMKSNPFDSANRLDGAAKVSAQRNDEFEEFGSTLDLSQPRVCSRANSTD
jgi:hypothetical protein